MTSAFRGQADILPEPFGGLSPFEWVLTFIHFPWSVPASYQVWYMMTNWGKHTAPSLRLVDHRLKEAGKLAGDYKTVRQKPWWTSWEQEGEASWRKWRWSLFLAEGQNGWENLSAKGTACTSMRGRSLEHISKTVAKDLRHEGQRGDSRAWSGKQDLYLWAFG